MRIIKTLGGGEIKTNLGIRYIYIFFLKLEIEFESL